MIEKSTQTNKYCSFCECEHPLTEEFWYITKRGHHRCRLRTKSHEQKRQGKRAEYNSEFRKKNLDAIRKREKEYNCVHREDKAEYNKLYYENNKPYYQANHAEHYQKNLVENQRKGRENYYNNKSKRLAYSKKYNKIRKSTDTNFKLACNLRTRLCQAIGSNQKAGSAVRDLGCTIPELKQYLELKFKEGMTWENWGTHGWHIDHIIPLVSFDLTDREQFLKACHYTNLQPLWALDNLKKSAKTDGCVIK